MGSGRGHGRGRGRGFEDWCPSFCSPFTAVLFVIVLITSVILIIASFSAVDETEACLTVNKLTGEVSEEVSSEPGNYFIGVEKTFVCFTKSLQRLDFTKKHGNPLNTRTRQGLPIELDITLEYRLMTHELRDLLLEFPVVPSTEQTEVAGDEGEEDISDEEKVGEGDDEMTKYSMSYREFYKHLAYAELRNVAAQYTAQEFLSQARQKIAQEMEEGMIKRMGAHHAQVVAFQLRQVYLPKKFEEGIMKIVTMQQEQAVAVQDRKAKLEQEALKTEKRLEELVKARDTAVIEERGKRDAWSSTRAKQMQENQNDRVGKLTLSQQTRDETILGLEGGVKAATSDQKRETFEANTTLTATTDYLVPARTTLADAERDFTYDYETNGASSSNAAGRLGKVAAKAESDAQAAVAVEEGAGLTKVLDGDVKRYNDLKAAGLSEDDIVKHVWIDTLKKLKDAKFFLSYNKVPFLMEAAGLSPEDVANALAGK